MQIRKAAILCLAALSSALLLISCGKHTIEYNDSNFGEVIFVNSSNCSIDIHQESFSGSLLVEKLVPGGMESVEVRPSDNYGVGSVFPIRYWCDVASGGIIGIHLTSGIDPNMQIPYNIEAGEIYTIYVPKPSNAKFSESYIKIVNNSDMPFELRRLSITFKQADNKEIPVPSKKTGVYKLGSGDVEIKNYTIEQGMDFSYPFPEFIAKDGYIYNFEFDGKEVIQKEEQKIGF